MLLAVERHHHTSLLATIRPFTEIRFLALPSIMPFSIPTSRRHNLCHFFISSSTAASFDFICHFAFNLIFFYQFIFFLLHFWEKYAPMMSCIREDKRWSEPLSYHIPTDTCVYPPRDWPLERRSWTPVPPTWLIAVVPVGCDSRVTVVQAQNRMRTREDLQPMFPVRVTVETVRAQHCLSCAHDGHVLIDTYAIVSGSTALNQLVETVLSALGHPQLATNARGLVQVNNWKALPFEQITDNQDDTVQSLFKDISSHITLRILSKPTNADSASTQCINELKQRLLKAAVNKNPQILNTVDNQQIKELITQIIAGDDPSMLNHDQINAIHEWLETIDTGDERRSPTSQMRFNAVFEIPKLERWHRADPSPSRQKLMHYLTTLNSSPYRKSHPKINYYQICNWFANKRATSRTPGSTPIPNPQQAQTQSLQNQMAIIASLMENRPKFDFSNLIDQKPNIADITDETRIDGGSDSPSPADDEMHSNSDGGHNDHFLIKSAIGEESSASSPDMTTSVRESIASTSPKHSQSDSIGNNSGLGSQARSRLMFDPLSELPVLEKWFEENPHPTWMQIDQYTQALNGCPYRENYPHISQHNVKIWFKNRRAKCKRMQTGMMEKMGDKIYA
ncbi:unnamed protein product [Caenorhabditis auriculariae]|uniref:Homeobox domain-containing protein n=1 Tax=Caenorhabditis auriculariae TaxID=2777116 RepID=A0A8S1H1C2_9PELO|nr:unnamed protein product [Caenorhabditis auriculariae]